jgi:hypothetical protein
MEQIVDIGNLYHLIFKVSSFVRLRKQITSKCEAFPVLQSDKRFSSVPYAVGVSCSSKVIVFFYVIQ